MKLFKLLWAESRALFATCILLSLFNAAAMLSLVTGVTQGVVGLDTIADIWPILGLGLATLGATGVLLPVLTTLMCRRAVEEVRRRLLLGTIRADIERLEQVGSASILASLSEDGMRLTTVLPSTIGVAKGLITLAVCLVVLAATSPYVAAVALALVAIIGIANYWIRGFAIRQEALLMSHRERVLRVFRDIFDGIKELKSRPTIRDALVETARRADLEIRTGLRKASLFTGSAESLTTVLLLIALLAVALNEPTAGDHTTSIVMLVLMIGTTLGVVGSLQLIGEGMASLYRVERLTAALESTRSALDEPHPTREHEDPRQITIEFRDVTYRYESARGPGYELLPTNVVLRAGEVLFIVGGNGSGKTTFVKLLTGLYRPTSGSVLFHGRRLEDSERPWYVRQFSVVFSDFCLFDSLAGTEHEPSLAGSSALLERSGLERVVVADRGVLAQARQFSSGQRRRVALLLSLIEDRPVFVFDEFAADQDPATRDFFYRTVLPDLRSRGKLVVVITHDTRYMDSSDSVLTFERGQAPAFSRRRRDYPVQLTSAAVQ